MSDDKLSGQPQNPEEVKKLQEVMEAGRQNPELEKQNEEEGEEKLEECDCEEEEEEEEEREEYKQVVECGPAKLQEAIAKVLLSDTQWMGADKK